MFDGNHEEERFAAYLRTFEPVAPPPLVFRTRPHRHLSRLLAVAAVVLVAVLLARRPVPEAQTAKTLTLGNANELLADSASWSAVIDDAGFRFRAGGGWSARAQGRSALDFLSKEDLSR